MVVNNIKSKLMDIGFTEYEAKVYIALVSNHPATAYEVAKRAAVPTSKVYEVLSKLTDRGALSEIDDNSKIRYIPLAPDDLISNYRSRIGTTLDSLLSDLKLINESSDLSFIRTIRDYGYLIDKAKRMIEEARSTLLLSLWPKEMELLRPLLRDAVNRDVQTAIILFGPASEKIGCTYSHPIEETVYREAGGQGFVIAADSSEVLFAKVKDNGTAEGIHSISKGIVAMAEDFIKHDIYIMKIIRKFDPLMQKTYGKNYAKLRNVFKEDDI